MDRTAVNQLVYYFFAPLALAGPINYQKYRHFQSPFALTRFRSPRSLIKIVQFVHVLCIYEKKKKKSFRELKGPWGWCSTHP